MSSRDFIWTVEQPIQWPLPPDMMSYSTAERFEACGHRWALEKARYQGIAGRYPDRPRAGTLAGTIVHGSIEEIVKALGSSEITALSDPAVPEVLQRMGGIQQVVDRNMTMALENLQRNPRAEPILDTLSTKLSQRRSEMRRATQSGVIEAYGGGVPVSVKPQGRGTDRRALPAGVHPEVYLEAAGIGWMGIVDVIRLTPSACEIIDFKTGDEKESHEEQLRIYAALWYLDEIVNPAGQLVTDLKVFYGTYSKSVPPPEETEYVDIIESLVRRKRAIELEMQDCPPEANVLEEVCRYCDVKQLCDPFWQYSHESANDYTGFCDAEVTVIESRGARSWVAHVNRSTAPVPEKEVIVLGRHSGQVQVGDTYRLLGAWLEPRPEGIEADHDSEHTLRLTTTTEVFLYSGERPTTPTMSANDLPET